MPENSKPNDLAAAWRNQAPEERPVTLNFLIDRRTDALSAATRSEIVTALAAPLLFVGILGWRFTSEHDRLPQLGLLAALAWVLISLYWFGARIWPRKTPKDSLAATGLDHYRRELQLRRDHLRNEWLWHGPLFLACLTLIAIFAGQRNFRNLQSALPLVVVLFLWSAFGLYRRRRQAADLQRELDELSDPQSR